MIFYRFIKRHNLGKYIIHFHCLKHTFLNMLFETNENPKAIQQLLGHRDIKTTITVYNSVDNEYIRNTTDKLNEKIKGIEMHLYNQKKYEDFENGKNDLISRMTDEDYNETIMQLLEERKEIKLKKRRYVYVKIYTKIYNYF